MRVHVLNFTKFIKLYCGITVKSSILFAVCLLLAGCGNAPTIFSDFRDLCKKNLYIEIYDKKKWDIHYAEYSKQDENSAKIIHNSTTINKIIRYAEIPTYPNIMIDDVVYFDPIVLLYNKEIVATIYSYRYTKPKFLISPEVPYSCVSYDDIIKNTPWHYRSLEE